LAAKPVTNQIPKDETHTAILSHQRPNTTYPCRLQKTCKKKYYLPRLSDHPVMNLSTPTNQPNNQTTNTPTEQGDLYLTFTPMGNTLFKRFNFLEKKKKNIGTQKRNTNFPIPQPNFYILIFTHFATPKI
jgi:hypothetical protein